MSKEKMSMIDIRRRKTRLKDDLELLEGSFENRYRKAKKSLLGSFKPVETIKKRPFQSIGVAVILGLAAGLSSKKKAASNGQENSGTVPSRPGFTGLLFDEVKRLAARRAASYISEVIDERMTKK